MRIFIDGKEWRILHMDALSREEILEMVREELAWEDRVITDILSDGESLDEKDFLTVPDDIDVEIFSNTAEGVGTEVLDEVGREMEAVEAAVKETVKALEGWQSHAGHEKLHGLIDRLAWVSQALADFRGAFSDQNGPALSASSLAEELERFHELLCQDRSSEAVWWYEEAWCPELRAFQESLKAWKQRLAASEEPEKREKL